MRRGQLLVSLGVFAIAGVVAAGATQIPGVTGYTGVGANFLPWLVALALALCGAGLMREAISRRPAPSSSGDDERPDWLPVVWVSAGLLLNAALITKIGFVLSCALLFVLAARGFRLSMGQRSASAHDWVRDALIGVALAAPTYWMFTKLLGLTLPGLTTTGWI
jgi:putative tricarboxylic transport membrane protein